MTTSRSNDDAPPIKLVNWSELPVASSPYLVKNVIAKSAFGIIYGAPGSMKSFLAMDLACHIAMGRDWHGARVKQGPVCYIACEGGDSIGRRMLAWRQFYNVADEEAPEVPLFVIRQTVNFGTKEKGDNDAGRVSNRITEIEKELERKFSLIIVDTVSQSLAGQNENSPEGLGAFIFLMNKLREQTEAAVLGVHHTGKDAEKGARGWSGLLGAVSTEIAVVAEDGFVDFKATKQRDMDKAKCDFCFEPQEVALLDQDGEELVDEDGDRQTTLIMSLAENGRPERPDPLPKPASFVLSQLWEVIDPKNNNSMAVPGQSADRSYGPACPENMRGMLMSNLRDICKASPDLSNGKSRNAPTEAFRKAVKCLEGRGLVVAQDDWIWPLSKETEVPF